MKNLFILLLILIPLISFSQFKTGYYLTAEQHELLRKDLKDYKILINKYDVLSKDFEKLKKDFENARSINSKQINEINTLKNQNIESHNLKIKISNLENEISELKEKNYSLQKENEYKTKSLFNYKSKYYKELKLNRGDRIISNSIIGVIVVCGLWTIYTSIENHYLDK